MQSYIITNELGVIVAAAGWNFPDSTITDKEVVRGWDGNLYFSDAVPQKPLSLLAGGLRHKRDNRIAATDYLMAADYPLSTEARASVSAYRQALRDLPQQEGFPWVGGGPEDGECPWPALPATLTRKGV